MFDLIVAALFGAAITKLAINEIRRYRKKMKKIQLEARQYTSEEVAEIFKKEGYSHIELVGAGADSTKIVRNREMQNENKR